MIFMSIIQYKCKNISKFSKIVVSRFFNSARIIPIIMWHSTVDNIYRNKNIS